MTNMFCHLKKNRFFEMIVNFMDKLKEILIGLFYADIVFCIVSVFYFFGIHSSTNNLSLLMSYIVISPFAFFYFILWGMVFFVLNKIDTIYYPIKILIVLISSFVFFRYLTFIKARYKVMIFFAVLSLYGLLSASLMT